MCGQAYPSNSPTCPRCGYTPASSAPDVEAGWKQKIPLPPRPNIPRTVVGAVVVALLLPLIAGLLFLTSFSRDISSGGMRVDRPEAAGPGPGESRERGCEQIMRRYLRDLADAFGKANPTATLFIAAANEFGPGSGRYRALIDIYGDVEVNTLMAEGKTAAALRRARPQIRTACER